MKRFRVGVLVCFVLGLVTASALMVNFLVEAATVIVDDTFADGNASNQDLPNNSLQVFKSRSATVRTATVGNVDFDLTATGTSSDAYWAYFTNSGTPVTLGVGDSVTLTANFSVTGLVGTGQDIRFGLLDSKGTRQVTDLTGGQNATTFGDDTGYAAQYFASGLGSPFVLYRRDVTTPTPTTNIFNTMATTGGFQPITGTGATARQALSNATPYVFTYTVSRLSATQTQVTIGVTGGTLSGLNYTAIETSTTPYNTFDTFHFRIGGNGFATKLSFQRLKVEYTPSAPQITTQPGPTTQTISAGANTFYTVVASGNGLSYQWLKDDSPISGNASAQTATLQLNNAQTTDTGVYKVQVTNGGGTVTSDPVSLTVVSGPTDPIPVINTPPQSTTAVLGTPASLTVSATGPNMNFQWFKNGSPIGGANAATLSFPSVSLTDTADYTVSVSNGGGTVTSAPPARLTVVSAMSATAFGPTPLSTGVCADKPLSITFDQAPKVGTSGLLRIYESNGTLVDTIDMAASPQTRTIGGVSAFRYFPIIVEGNTANIYPHVTLGYNKTYYVTLEPGVLTDVANAPFVGISDVNAFRFSTKTTAPTAGAGVITVDDNGPADFCTIQAAIDSVPANNAQRVVINVKDGTYTEIIYIPSNKPFITVKGESRAGTIQRYSNNCNLNCAVSGNYRTSFGVDAADFAVENITLWNTTPQGGSQAEALRTNGLRAVVNSVDLKSFQDTLLTQRSAFVTNSYIEGDVDFMWGNGQTYFKNTEFKQLRTTGGYYTQIRNNVGTVGNVYVGCTFSVGAGVTTASYLGRIDPDDFPGSQVVLIDSKMASLIFPEGWQFNGPALPVTSANYPNIRYWEFNSKQLDGVTPVDCSLRHPISRNDCNNPLTLAEVDFYRDPLNVTGFTPQEKLTALVSLSNTTQVYDGSPKPITVTTDPAGLTVSVTYNGSTTVPTDNGTYAVVATVTDPAYTGSASGTLTIQKAPATVTLTNLTQDFDGSPKSPTVTTVPAGLSYSLTFNGSATVPSAVGNYTTVATVTDPNYTGSSSVNFNIKSTVKAFPTAEGAGQWSVGGRGGDTYHVTNLNDTGAGSLRNGITTATGPRTIVFDVSGTIELNSRLNINKSFITIAGQTAPGDGITISGWTTTVSNAQHVIIRYVRFRPGDIRCANGMEGDALWVDNSKDVVIDHVSASWSIDESLSVTDSDRVSVQWSFITESLTTSCHPEGAHGYGALIRFGNGRISYHHNLFAHHTNRNPRVGDNITLDFVNNVIYDWGTDASYSGAATEGITKVNYLANYLVAGPNTPAPKRTRAFNGGSTNTWIYQNGNVIDSNVNGLHDGTDTGWAMFVNLYTQQNAPLDLMSGRDEKVKETTVNAIDINPATAGDAYTQVLDSSGASKTRDSVDARVANQVRTETGAPINSQNAVGGWPVLNSTPAPTDTDGDGIPDAVETANGLNPNDPADAAFVTATGYTNLEKFVNGQFIVPTAANVTVSGRVMSSRGGGLSRVIVTMTDTATGATRSVVTNSFGVYSFDDVASGGTYVVTATSNRYSFVNGSQVINVGESIADLDFTANE